MLGVNLETSRVPYPKVNLPTAFPVVGAACGRATRRSTLWRKKVGRISALNLTSMQRKSSYWGKTNHAVVTPSVNLVDATDRLVGDVTVSCGAQSPSTSRGSARPICSAKKPSAVFLRRQSIRGTIKGTFMPSTPSVHHRPRPRISTKQKAGIRAYATASASAAIAN